MSSQRTIITISDKDKSWLEAYSKKNGISITETIRRGILELREKESENLYKTLVRETQGIWEEGDGLRYQEKIRAEWGE
jgi:hypothetical protein